jgi:hypothetical protein
VIKQKGETHTLRVFGMSNNTVHLFSREEACEARAEDVCSSMNLWNTKVLLVPGDGASSGEQVLHQLGLVAQVDRDMALAQFGVSQPSQAKATIVRGSSNLGSGGLDVTVHGLASRTLHDDVDGEPLQMRFDQVVHGHVLADKLLDFCHGEAIGDLNATTTQRSAQF